MCFSLFYALHVCRGVLQKKCRTSLGKSFRVAKTFSLFNLLRFLYFLKLYFYYIFLDGVCSTSRKETLILYNYQEIQTRANIMVRPLRGAGVNPLNQTGYPSLSGRTSICKNFFFHIYYQISREILNTKTKTSIFTQSVIRTFSFSFF